MKLLPLCLLSVLFCGARSITAGEPLPEPWKHQDIGAADVPGTADAAAGVFTIQGTMDIWGVADGCHIVWQPQSGDLELIARVTAMENPGGVAHAKAALCIRESLDAGARHVTLCVTPTDGTQFVYRDKANEKTTRVPADVESQKASVPKGQFPCWLKLTRHGNEFAGYESTDGEKWQLIGRVTLQLPGDAIVGLSASSHKKDILTKATFDHVKLSMVAASTSKKP